MIRNMALSSPQTCHRRNWNPFSSRAAAKTTAAPSIYGISFLSSSNRLRLPKQLAPKPLKNPKSNSRNARSTITALFTGIVEEMGTVKRLDNNDDSFTMKIGAKTVLEDVHLGDSISVNGTCLTVTEFDTASSEFSVGLSPETLRKTNLGELGIGSPVNLERAVSPTTRMGGHFVQGHVDGTGQIVGMTAEGDSLWVKVKVERKDLLRYIVPKGFVAVDGTSLTVVNVFDDESCFDLVLVAYTQQKIVIPLKRVGDKVNLEVDILGKYVERLIAAGLVDSIVGKSSSS
ncbi:lumazine-binding family protein [Striga hermonthica]|uniref:Riboflavin synthase n=1 Tax=Striga hermonthica TaxID=68872 RepID=A0A9N7NZT1_STRHE|nr:lumazine-binding family protein [Striga hermonthica]